MRENHCSLFPDRWRFIIDYDIAFLCEIHDFYYEAMFPTWTRKEADTILLEGLIRYRPEYRRLWSLVYRAVRTIGWLPWYTHRLENATGIKLVLFKDKWASVRTKLESTNAIA